MEALGLSKSIRINHPSDGQWIMDRAGGGFDPERDRCVANLSADGTIMGGFVFQNYTGRDGSIAAHMAGVGPRWCSRDLLWMCFDYCFNQLGVHKILAPVPAQCDAALEQDYRAGYVYEATIKHVFPGGGDLIVLSMTRKQCRWLNIKQSNYRRNYEETSGG